MHATATLDKIKEIVELYNYFTRTRAVSAPISAPTACAVCTDIIHQQCTRARAIVHTVHVAGRSTLSGNTKWKLVRDELKKSSPLITNSTLTPHPDGFRSASRGPSILGCVSLLKCPTVLFTSLVQYSVLVDVIVNVGNSQACAGGN